MQLSGYGDQKQHQKGTQRKLPGEGTRCIWGSTRQVWHTSNAIIEAFAALPLAKPLTRVRAQASGDVRKPLMYRYRANLCMDLCLYVCLSSVTARTHSALPHILSLACVHECKFEICEISKLYLLYPFYTENVKCNPNQSICVSSNTRWCASQGLLVGAQHLIICDARLERNARIRNFVAYPKVTNRGNMRISLSYALCYVW